MGLREVIDRAGEMPHRKPAGDNQHDARLESELGRLFFSGYLTEGEYEAGVNYGHVALLYLESIDAPAPFGGEIAAIEDDVCFRRKMAVAAARSILKLAGQRCAIAVDRVAVYDEPARDDLERHALRIGLRALSGH